MLGGNRIALDATAVVLVLAALVDFIELMRRGADWAHATPLLLAKISIFRVPQLTERILPFTVLVGAMSCYLTLSRRLELVVARAAGVSVWQFLTPAVLVALLTGIIAVTIFNPAASQMEATYEQLDARYLLEGSVRRVGDRVRLTAELSEAATGGTFGPKPMMSRSRTSSACRRTLPSASSARRTQGGGAH